MRKTITLPLLNLVTLSGQEQEILNQVESRGKLEFVRNAILDFASRQGFELIEWIRPIYVPASKWQKVQEAKTKHRSVDYSYVIAYFWLKSLPEFSYRQKSDIIREAIKSYRHDQ